MHLETSTRVSQVNLLSIVTELHFQEIVGTVRVDRFQ